MMQSFFAPQILEENILKVLRMPSFYNRWARVAAFAFVMVLWSLLWTDVWRAYFQLGIPSLVEHLYVNVDPGIEFIVKGLEQLLYVILAYPIVLLIYHLVRQSMRQKLESEASPITNKQPLTFQEQNVALSKVPLFVSLSENSAGELFRQMETKFYADGQAMVNQGEVGDEFFIIVRGKATATYLDQAGNTHVVGHLEEGDAFGEVALLDAVPRTATIASDGGCYAVILQKAKFQNFIATTSTAEEVKQMIRLSSFLKKHPLFQRLEAKDLAEVIKNLHYESLAPRDQMSGLQLCENFYIVYSGQIKVDTGDDATDFLLGPEDSFGFSPFSPEGVKGEVSSPSGAGLLRLQKDIFLDYVWDRFLNRPELLWSK